jgi:hypothetical protein
MCIWRRSGEMGVGVQIEEKKVRDDLKLAY